MKSLSLSTMRKFYNAIENNRIHSVERLLKEYPTLINHKYEKNITPLYKAVQLGCVEITKLLLTQDGVDVNKAQDMSTPLSLTMYKKNDAIIELLSQQKANLYSGDYNNVPIPEMLSLYRETGTVIQEIYEQAVQKINDTVVVPIGEIAE